MQLGKNELSLVLACLSNDLEFEEKLRSWEIQVKLEDLNYGAVRLLPFLQSRILDSGIQSLHAEKLQGISRYFWAKRRMQEKTINESIIPFLAGTQPLALKGLALEQVVYKSSELRPIDDVDFLVSRQHFKQLDSKFEQHNLKYVEAAPRSSYDYLRHARSYRGKYADIDVHWTCLPLGCDSKYDERISRRAELKPGTPEYLIPTTTDLLLHTVIHGNRPNQVSPVRWLVDSSLLINRTTIKWDLLWDEARSLGLGRELKAGLELLGRVAEVDLVFPKKVSSTASFTLGHTASRLSFRSNSLWFRRFLRMLGSDLPIVAKALARDGVYRNKVMVIRTTIRESLKEIRQAFGENSLSALLSGKWSVQESDTAIISRKASKRSMPPSEIEIRR